MFVLPLFWRNMSFFRNRGYLFFDPSGGINHSFFPVDLYTSPKTTVCFWKMSAGFAQNVRTCSGKRPDIFWRRPVISPKWTVSGWRNTRIRWLDELVCLLFVCCSGIIHLPDGVESLEKDNRMVAVVIKCHGILSGCDQSEQTLIAGNAIFSTALPSRFI